MKTPSMNDQRRNGSVSQPSTDTLSMAEITIIPKRSERAGMSSRWIIMVCGMLVLAGLVAYHNCFTVPFLFDDIESIVQNPTIRRLWPIWHALSPPQDKGFTVAGRPVLNFSFAINYAFGGNSPWGYHAVNLAIHILAGLTLFGIVRRTIVRPGLREHLDISALSFALPVAIFWILHPLQTESVTYRRAASESLMGLFLPSDALLLH